jgi:competence protein ComEC
LFGHVSVVGLLANLVAVPWVTFVITPLALLGTLFAPIWVWGAWASQWLMAVLQWFAGWPLAVLERPALPAVLAVLAAVGGLLLVLRLPWAFRAWGGLLLWPALAYQPPRPAVGDFELWAADVGQGTAIVVRTAKHTLVYDTGPPIGASNAGDRVLLPMLRTWGDQPQMVVLSHNDSDHTGGFAPLNRRFPKTELRANFEPSVPSSGASHASAAALNPLPCQQGQSWEWDGVVFEVLHPNPDYPSQEDNARSCVVRVGLGLKSAWLTGDITTAEEAHLLGRLTLGSGTQAGVLFAGHHGSKTSNGEPWLRALSPRWVVVQAGLRSRYGHPSPEVVRRFEALGLPWVNTAHCGAVRWRSNAPQTLHCSRQEQLRYWHWQMPAQARPQAEEG